MARFALVKNGDMRAGKHTEIDELRLDIATLRVLIAVALDRGVSGCDRLLQCCANVLYQRRMRLEELERGEQASLNPFQSLTRGQVEGRRIGACVRGMRSRRA